MLRCFGKLQYLIEMRTTEVTIIENIHTEKYEQLQLTICKWKCGHHNRIDP